jgi:hypothetical protein
MLGQDRQVHSKHVRCNSQEEERGDEVLEGLRGPAADDVPLFVGGDVMGTNLIGELASAAAKNGRRVRFRNL